MNIFILILLILLFSGCSTIGKLSNDIKSALKSDYTPITNPDIKGRPVYYSMPQASEYIPLGEISASVSGSVEISCDTLADTALDKLIDESRKMGGHAVGKVSFSECNSGRSNRYVSVEGVALLNYNLMPASVAGIGDIFFSHEDKDFRWDLTIIELTSDRISLQYNEYTNREGSWLIKQGFNKTFSYQLANKIIAFREYEFDILNYSLNKITYKITLPSLRRSKASRQP